MGDVHLTRELLDAVFGEERSPRELIPVVLGHLFDLCPTCEEAFNAWRDSIPVTAALSYGEIAAHAVDRATDALEQIRAEEKKAKAHLDDLLEMTAEERISFVEAVPEDAKGPALAKGLIEAAREAMPGNPRDSLALAQLARTVLQHADLSPFVAELYARAVAYVGNALRVLGSLSEAAEVMAHARFILRQEGGGDRLTRSELDNLEGMVRLYQRNYPEAERLLKRAVLGFRFAGAQRESLRSRMNLATAYRYRGDLTNAIELQRQVNDELERAGENRLLLFGHYNLAAVLCDATQYGEAQKWLNQTTRQNAPIGLLRSEWLQGSMAYSLGDLPRAESHFLAAQYGFRKFGLDLDTALVALDLACAYLDGNRWTEVRALAKELVEVFEGQERHGEALAAVLVFRAAAELERLTVDLVKDIAAYLRQAALDPNYKFTKFTASKASSSPSATQQPS